MSVLEEPAVSMTQPSCEEKIATIEYHYQEILKTLGLDLSDESIQKTPHRVAKMLVKELCKGLDPSNFPKLTHTPNHYGYDQMLLESNISIKSMCEHHLVPFLGHCHIAYIPGDRVIGLSKLNRIAHHFARKPQVQERLTKEIQDCLMESLDTEDVAVVIDAVHLCVHMRGVEDDHSVTRTYGLGGRFKENPYRQELFSSIPKKRSVL